MDQMPRHEDWDENGLPIGETPEQRAAREAREAESIARGMAELKAGRVVDWDDAMAYFDALDRGENPPPLFPDAPPL